MSSAECARMMRKAALQARCLRSTPPLRVSFEPAEHRQLILREWQALELSLKAVSLSCSTAWVESWLNTYGALVPYRFAVGRTDGRMCAVTLVCQGVGRKDGPFPIRTLHLGTAGEPEQHNACVEYNAVLAEPGFHDAFLRELLAVLCQEHGWDEIRLDGFPLADVEPFLPASALREVRISRYLDLAEVRATSGDPLALLGRSTRANLRRKLRPYGKITTEWAETLERSQAIFEEMVVFHQARWQAAGQCGAYASPCFRQFSRELIERLFPTRRTALIRVACDGAALGCVHLLIDGDRVMKYQGGAAPYHDSHESPGLVTDFMAVQASLERGYNAFDHLAGDNQAKQNLSTAANELVWARIRRPGLKCAALDILRQVRKRFRDRTGRQISGEQEP
jgi:hypothetical protein